MKSKNNLVLVTALFNFSLTVFAQEQQSTGPIPKIKNYNPPTIVNNSDNLAWLALGHSSLDNYTVSFQLPAGTPFTHLFNWAPTTFASSMTANPQGLYYITETGPPAKLHQMTYFGEVTPVGEIIGMGSEKPNGIAYNLVNQSFYIASGINLYSFDPNNLNATLIGPFNTGANIIDLCFNENGVCFAYDVVTDCAYTINISTGEASLLGSLGYDANFGQGMSYDLETQTIYLSAFNNSTFTGQLRAMNPQTGMTTLIVDWGLIQLAPFAVVEFIPPLCPIGYPSNPNPPNGANNVPITGNTLTWTNGVGTVNVELWFGQVGIIVKIYDGPATTSFPLPTLNYDTQYEWYVVCKDEICGTQGLNWSFTTIEDPNLTQWCEEFNDLGDWTIIGPQGFTNWSTPSSSTAGGTPPELQMSWSPSFTGESKIRSDYIPLAANQCCSFSFKLYFGWYADPSGVFTVGVTYDGGITDTILYLLDNPTQNIGPTFVSTIFKSPSSGSQNCQIEIAYSGNSFNTDNIYLDDICIDYMLSSCDPPIAPSNLTAQVINNPSIQVRLNWEDNSQGEYGFKIFRKLGYPTDPGEFNVIDTVYNNITQYLDEGVIEDSIYSYYVASFNQYGQSNSDTVSIIASVPVGVKIEGEELPKEFALMQNYPNPFNPSTKIKYQIPLSPPLLKGESEAGGFITLKVYDILGNEVATLVNEEQSPGVYEVEFNTESSFRLVRNLTSGIYFYQLRVGSFVDTKKMILLR